MGSLQGESPGPSSLRVARSLTMDHKDRGWGVVVAQEVCQPVITPGVDLADAMEPLPPQGLERPWGLSVGTPRAACAGCGCVHSRGHAWAGLGPVNPGLPLPIWLWPWSMWNLGPPQVPLGELSCSTCRLSPNTEALLPFPHGSLGLQT